MSQQNDKKEDLDKQLNNENKNLENNSNSNQNGWFYNFGKNLGEKLNKGYNKIVNFFSSKKNEEEKDIKKLEEEKRKLEEKQKEIEEKKRKIEEKQKEAEEKLKNVKNDENLKKKQEEILKKQKKMLEEQKEMLEKQKEEIEKTKKRLKDKKKEQEETQEKAEKQINPSEEISKNDKEPFRFMVTQFKYKLNDKEFDKKMAEHAKKRKIKDFNPDTDIINYENGFLLKNFKKYYNEFFDKNGNLKEGKTMTEFEFLFNGRDPSFPLEFGATLRISEKHKESMIGRFVRNEKGEVIKIKNFTKNGIEADKDYKDNFIDRLAYSTYNGFKNYYFNIREKYLGVSGNATEEEVNKAINEGGVVGFFFGITEKVGSVFKAIGTVIYKALSKSWEFVKSLVNTAYNFVKDHPYIALGIAAILLATTFFFKDKIYNWIFGNKDVDEEILKKLETAKGAHFNILTKSDQEKFKKNMIVVLLPDKDKQYSHIEYSLPTAGAYYTLSYDEFKKIYNEQKDKKNFKELIKKLICVYDDDNEDIKIYPNVNGITNDIHKKAIQDFIGKKQIKDIIKDFGDKVRFISSLNITPISHLIGPTLATEKKDYLPNDEKEKEKDDDDESNYDWDTFDI